MTQQTIMIADDHAVVRDGLCRLLESSSDYQVIAETESAEGMIALCGKQLPELVLMDLSMPGMGGVEGLRRLHSKWPKLKIIIFSIYENQQLVKRVLEVGARGYITKSSNSEVILQGIAEVLAGHSFVSPDVEMDLPRSPSELPAGPLDKLSGRELDIFRNVAEGLSTEQIANKLYISEKTVANYVSMIKKKLGVANTTELVHLALREGLLLDNFGQ